MTIDQSASDFLEEGFENEDTLEGKFLTFSIGSEEYGIPIRYVIEIIGIQDITELPQSPIYVKGVINLRGKVIPVIDVRLRFAMNEREYDERTCIVVVSIEETVVGLIVDQVSEVMEIPDSEIEPPPSMNRDESSRYIEGLGKTENKVKILLNVQKLLFREELEKLETLTQQAE